MTGFGGVMTVMEFVMLPVDDWKEGQATGVTAAEGQHWWPHHVPSYLAAGGASSPQGDRGGLVHVSVRGEPDTLHLTL